MEHERPFLDHGCNGVQGELSTRREFMRDAATVALTVATLTGSVPAAVAEKVSSKPIKRSTISRVKAAVRREESTLRLGGMGDNFHMSWAGDGRQIFALCDGLGWADQPKEFYNSRLYSVAGDPHGAKIDECSGYPPLTGVLNTENMMRYYGFGTLAVDGRIYQYLSTPNHQFSRDSVPLPGARFIGAKLIYSPDNGRTWRNQDGSTPVTWERWEQRSRDNMVFYEESRDAFSLLSVLQMGRNYEANNDGYVYVYSPNGNVDGEMNELVMFRVPKAKILDRGAYEYFAGLRHGRATWDHDIAGRAVVHRFPLGWVNTAFHPWAWMPSVTYNVGLGVYMMASWGNGCSADGVWFSKPSYLGLWLSTTPWGPWVQIHEENSWTPMSDSHARAFAPQISPKWVSDDGKSFWMVWSDFQSKATQVESQHLREQAKRVASREESVRYFQDLSKVMPFYGFNTQRVELILV